LAYKFLIIGAGLSGTVVANRLVQKLDCEIEIWDERSHIGGNCYTSRDAKTGVMVHEYGPHIFNTDNKEIWDFVNSFMEFKPYVHRVKAMSNGKVYSFPVNLHTINQLFQKSFNPAEAKEFLESLGDKSITTPQNFEEQALRLIGRELYEAFFHGYTKKQWGCEPTALPASILKRIPVRFNYDDNYHNNIYTGIPVDGYTALIERFITSDRISVKLNQKFSPQMDLSGYDHVFYTGPIDAWFKYKYGRLGYRTVKFETIYAKADYQGVAQMNYCDANIPYTRITEHKHFAYWEKHENTICFKEFSVETGENDLPYYPKRLSADKTLLLQYREEAALLKKVSFLGRLATYRYMDMHHVIGEALQYSNHFLQALESHAMPSVFPNTEA
jgi:UDP-galactopyranose mutase